MHVKAKMLDLPSVISTAALGAGIQHLAEDKPPTSEQGWDASTAPPLACLSTTGPATAEEGREDEFQLAAGCFQLVFSSLD